MKKITLISIFVTALAYTLSAQAQVPGFSNTVHAAFGKSPAQQKAKTQFLGFTDYFTGNITVGKITFAGDIAWRLIPSSQGVKTEFVDTNVNVVINPIKELHIGLGTNLDWTVGPGPSSGPEWSAYDKPYYGGINIENASPVSDDTMYPAKGFHVINYYAQKAFAVRYTYKDIFEAGFSLPVLNDVHNFNAGIGLKGNIADKLSIGFAYNGPFNTGTNYIYLGVLTKAIKGAELGVYWNMRSDTGVHTKDGAQTVGALLDFEINRLRIKPEGAVTFWSNNDWGPAGYLGADVSMNFSERILGGINASCGIGSDLIEGDPDDNIQAGARLNIHPYVVWDINKTNTFSAGAQLSPVWRRDGSTDFGWQVPISWKFKF